MIRTASRTIQRHAHTAGVENDHGESVDSWAAGVDVAVYAWAPTAITEPFENARAAHVTLLDVFAPDGTGFVYRDRATIDGDLYEVEGDPEDYTTGHNSTGAGVVVKVKRVEG